VQNSNAQLDDSLTAVVWGGGQFVAGGSSIGFLGDFGPAPIFTSPDGVVWTRSVLGNYPGQVIQGLSWNGSVYVVAGAFPQSNDQRLLATSTNGVDWTYDIPPPVGTNGGLMSVTWIGHHFVTVGNFGTVLTSTDGSTWVSDFTGTTAGFTSVAFANGNCVAVGFSGVIMSKPLCDEAIFSDAFDLPPAF